MLFLILIHKIILIGLIEAESRNSLPLRKETINRFISSTILRNNLIKFNATKHSAKSSHSTNNLRNRVDFGSSHELPARSLGWTSQFEDFQTQCPSGSAIKEISVRRVEKHGKLDARFNLRCEALRIHGDLGDSKQILVNFKTYNDRSVQSACEIRAGQFLCGLQGSYEDVRGMEALCCSYANVVLEPDKLPLAGNPLDTEATFVATGNSVISNIDQISDGTFVVQTVRPEPIAK